MKKYSTLAIPLLILTACSSVDKQSPTAPDIGNSVRPTSASISVTSLPSLGGASFARAINDDQVIVGTSNGLPVKWTFASGAWGVTPLQSTSGQAEDITEEFGVIVGSSGGSVILWSPPAFAPETIGVGVAAAINESQVVVGQDNSATDGNWARAWTRSGTGWVAHILPREAGFTGGYQAAEDINDDGIIVGYAADAGSAGTRPVKWVPSVNTPGEWDPAVPLDDVAAANLGGAHAIVGQDVVGEILRCFPPCARPTRDPYHWSLTGGGIGSLGTEDAWAQGLNAQRSIVGSINYRGHAFVWTVANPRIVDLGGPNGYGSAIAYDINSPKSTRTASQAVGEATFHNGKRVAVLWTIP